MLLIIHHELRKNKSYFSQLESISPIFEPTFEDVRITGLKI